MIDHLSINVSDYPRSLGFYRAALATLGLEVLMEDQDASGAFAGFGSAVRASNASFWIGQGQGAPTPIHLAFAAQTREQVEAFYQTAIAAGGTDNGAPGLRPEYHASYYAAFVLDPDGNNIEAVCHQVL